jgi:beta-lactamase superfamily II metal-dependent hydrolase
MPKRELFILDVGHGNCTLLRDENGIVIIDTGAGSALLEFLKAEKINRIEVILLSHADRDHIEGLIALMNSGEFEFGIIRYNPDSSKKSHLFDDLAYSLEDYNKRNKADCKTSLTTADTGEFDQGKVNIQILAPNTYIAGKSPGSKDRNNRLLTSNSNSVVIRLVLDGHPIALIPGDIDSVGFDNLLEDGFECNASIVVFPHHGGNPGTGSLESFVTKFCENTNPEIIIFSIGRGKYSNPIPELVSLVRQKIPTARILCTQLSKHCSPDLRITTQEHLTSKFAKGKQNNQCCAGTIEINLDNLENSILPELNLHKKFIEVAAPTSLCMKKAVFIKT